MNLEIAVSIPSGEENVLTFFPFGESWKSSPHPVLYPFHYSLGTHAVCMNPSSLAQFAGGDIVIIFVTLIAGRFLTLHGNGPLETAIRWFERQFYQKERGIDEAIIKS